MDNLYAMGAEKWIWMLAPISFVLCFYYTLTFFQHVKSDNERMAKLSKTAAVLFLAIGLLAPALYQFYIISVMMK